MKKMLLFIFVLLAVTCFGQSEIDSLVKIGIQYHDSGEYEKAIFEFGDNYLLYYNLGITYSKANDNKNAESAFISAIINNSNHAGSHFRLAFLEKEKNQRVQSLLSLYYFLLLEPSSKRAETAYKLLKEQLVGNVQKDVNNPMNINILINSQSMESEFAPAEMMLAMLEASNLLEENKDKKPDELFVDNTKSFFTVLGELNENKPNIWWNLYVSFFYELAKSEFVDVFCYYISISSNENSLEWLKTNNEKFEKFEKWIND